MRRSKCLYLLAAALCLASAPRASTAESERLTSTALYESLNPSIVKVQADGSDGSGFLVSGGGLVATNHHVVRNSRWIAVQFADGRKVRADIVVLEPRRDVAILKVNRSVVAGLQPLDLLPPDEDAALKPGVPVLAFGSPLSQTFLMTKGILSKVEDEVLLGDFLIQPGNSGGPLVTLEGEVVGINTFAVSQISGAVRVGVLRDLLSRPDVKESEKADPPADLLPNLRAKRFSTEMLKKRAMEAKVELEDYTEDGGKFTVTAITPVYVARTQIQDELQQAKNRQSRRGKKIKDPRYQPEDEPFYDWMRNAIGWLDYAVTIEIKPDFGTTSGSKWKSVFGGMGGVSTRSNFEFKAEFDDFKLYRDGALVTPLRPGRQITEASMEESSFTFVDEAYSGMYQYDPSAFLSGKEYKMEVFDARNPDKVHKTIKLEADSKMIRRIRADFAGAE